MGSLADILNSALDAIGIHMDDGPDKPRPVPRKPNSASPALVRKEQQGFYQDPNSRTGWSYSNPKGMRKSGVAKPSGHEQVITNRGKTAAKDWMNGNPTLNSWQAVGRDGSYSGPDVLQIRQWMMPDVTRPTSIPINVAAWNVDERLPGLNLGVPQGYFQVPPGASGY